MSEPNLQLSPPRFSSASTAPFSPRSPESPWTRTHLQLSPSPTLLYQCIASLHRHDGNIYSIAVLQGNVLTGSESRRIRVWKQPDFVERGYLKTGSGQVRAILAYGNLLFTTHKDNKVRVWSVSNSADDFNSTKVAVLPRRNTFMLFSKRKNQHQDCISCLAYYHAEGLLYTGSWDKTVKTWRVSDQRCIDSFTAHEDAINAIVVNQEDGFLFTCSSDGSVKIWRRVYGENAHTLTTTLKFQPSPVNALALSSSVNSASDSLTSSVYLYSASSDGFINFWEKERISGRYNHAGFLQGHQYSVLCLVAIDKIIISGSEDTTIRVWRRENGSSFHECLAVLNGHNGPVRCLSACVEMEKMMMGFLVFSASMDGTFKVWRVKIISESEDDIRVMTRDPNVTRDPKMKVVKCEVHRKSMDYEMSPVLSPSWVEKKIQGSPRF